MPSPPHKRANAALMKRGAGSLILIFLAFTASASLAQASSVFLRASLGGSTVDLLLGVGPPSSIAANPPRSQSSQVNTSFSSFLQATVTDSNGNPVPGAAVTFMAPSSGASAILNIPNSDISGSGTLTATTDSNGIAAVVAAANTVSGTYDVTASVDGVGASATFALTNTASAAFSVTSTSGSMQSAALNTAFAKSLVATVRDQYGNPVSGTSVAFSVPISGASANLSTYAVSTDSNGVASTTAMANNSVGAYNVAATIPGTNTSTSFALTNKNLASISLSSSKVSITFGSKVTFTAAVLPAGATGKVTFFDGGDFIGYTPLLSGASYASASLSTILLSSGTHSITAFYSGDSNYASISATTLVPAPTVTTVAATTFIPGASVVVGNAAASAIGDFNGDGVADLALTNASSGSITLLIGNGDGTFQSAVNYSLGSPLASSGATAKDPVAIVAADLNGDGFTDLAVANAGDGTVNILFGNGDGTFRAVQSALSNQMYTLGQLGSLAVGDFNGDGVPDLVITNSIQSYAEVMLGNGDGTFELQSATFPTGMTPVNIQVADVNGDGIVDLITANYDGNSVSVFLGNGDGSFAAAANYAVEKHPYQAVVGKFNRDGIPDIAVVAMGAGNVDVLLGQANGVFSPYMAYPVGLSPKSIVALDFNDDGNNDLAVVNNGDSTVTLLHGNGDGTFGTQRVYNVANGPQFVAVGDFNGDGKTDLAVYVNGSSEPSPSQMNLLLGVGASPGITPANGNAQSTMVSSNFSTALAVSISDANGNPITGVPVTFSAPSATTRPGASLSSSTAVTNSHGIASVTATANTVAGTYYASASSTGVTGSVQLQLTNTAGPAYTFIASQTSTPQSTLVNSAFSLPLIATAVDMYGNPVPGLPVSFAVPLSGATALLSASSGVTDSNGSVSVDASANGTAGSYLVAASIANTELFTNFSLTNAKVAPSVQLGSTNNPSTFGSNVVFTVAVNPASATGKVTLYDGVNPVATQPLTAGVASVSTIQLSSGKHALSAYYTGDVNYSPAKSQVVFQSVSPVPATTLYSAPNVTVGNAPVAIATGDFNGDGIEDLAVVNKTDATVSVLLGNGDGTFTVSATLTAGTAPVAIVAADLNGDGHVDLAVADSSSGNVEVLLGHGDGTFAVAMSTATLGGPTSLALGDFNSDGIPDLLVGLKYQGGLVVLLTGVGDGTFVGTAYAAVPGPVSLAVADFNNDGLPDFAVAGNSNNVSVFLNTGSGSFGSAVTLNVQSGQTFAAAGDLNGDGNTDLVVANTGSANLVVILGNGNGTFQSPATFSTGGTSPYCVQIADLNGDGNPDLAVGYLNGRTIDVLLGKGDGTFGSTTTYAAGSLPSSLVVGDFNGDGRADLAVANQESNTLAMLLGSGPANFLAITGGNNQSEPISTAFATSLQVLVTDSSGNPVPGLSVTFATPSSGAGLVLSSGTAITNNSGLASVTATSNTVAGTYTLTASVPGVPNLVTFALTNTAGPPASIVAAAGTPQTAAVNTPFASALQVLVTDAGGNPVPGVSVSFAVPTPGATAILSSIAATTNSVGAASVTAMANAIAGSYDVEAAVVGISTPVVFALTNSPLALSLTLVAAPNPVNFGGRVSLSALLNFSNATGIVTFYDGTNVLGTQHVGSGSATISTILLSSGKHSIHAYYSGDSTYQPAKSTPLQESINLVSASILTTGATQTVGTFPGFVAVADFNGDGRDDLAVVNSGSGNISMLLGKGDGTFAGPANYDVGQSPSAVVAVDLNSDGAPDLVVANSGSNSVSILLGSGQGTFGAATPVTGKFSSPASLAIGDFNNDGKPDVAVGNGGNSGVTILFGDGAGGFSSSTQLSIPAGSKALAVGDFNGDGNADIAIANNFTGSVLVLLGNGDGTFASPVSYGAGLTPAYVTVADFNGDGIADLAVANSGANNISVLLGNGDGTFVTASNFTVGSGPTSIAAVDLEGRGIVDLLVTNSADNTISYLMGNGDGTFAAQLAYPAGAQPVSIAGGDFNGDGKPDVALVNETTGTVGILLGAGPAATLAATAGATQSATVGTAFATALQVTVTDAASNPISNVNVTFTAPAVGASGTFAGGVTTATVPTNASGVATAPTFTANNVAGSFALTASVVGGASSAVFTLTNTSIAVLITTASLPSGVIGSPYSSSVTAQGGTTPYAWSVSSGSLPPGVTLNPATGAITGTPTGPAATGSFTVQLTDSASPAQIATKQLSITISTSGSTPSIVTASLANGVVGSSYSQTLTAQGGVAPYVWSVVSGTLPPGLSLAPATGVVSGIPTIAVQSTFTVTVKDGIGQNASASLIISVNALISLVLPNGTQQPGNSITSGQVQAAQPVSSVVTGTVTLNFNPDATGLSSSYVNPGVCFASSSCTSPPQTSTTFSIPAGSTSVSLPALQTGTVAGDIVATLSVTGQPDTTADLTIPRTAPVIEANSVQILDLTSAGFVVELVANSSPRDLQTASFTFNAVSGAQISGSATFTIDVSSALTQWYSSSEAQSYGSAFSLQIPFSLSGNPSAIQSVTVTLTNSAGTSASATGTP